MPLLDRYPREVPLSGRLRNPARLAALKIGKLAEWLKISRKSRTGLAGYLSSKLPPKKFSF